MTGKFNIIKQVKDNFKSTEIPAWFKIFNLVILLPILLWPFVFFTTIFFFDNPKSIFLTFLLFLAVNAYPIYLIVITVGNYKLYKRKKNLGLILPVTFSVLLTIGTIYIVTDIREGRKKADEIMKQKIESGDLGGGYRKDKIHVYYNDTIIESADPATFEFVNWQWERDNKHYFYQGKVVPYIDHSTFQYLDYHYAKDKNYVYYDDQIIEGADAKTFQHIEGSQDGKDKNYCYRYGEKVDCSELTKEE